jgi:hypothetical protein
MDWGKGILLTIIGFVAVIITMVVISVRMDGIELVTENYYEQEIKYQDQIDKENLTLGLGEVVMHYDYDIQSVVLDLPEGSKGQLHLFRPSDSSLDQVYKFETKADHATVIPVQNLKSGYWKFQLNWTVGGKEYYEEKKIDL